MPASYVKEHEEPVKVKKVIKKKELVNVPVKVQKKRIEKRYMEIRTLACSMLLNILLYTSPHLLSCNLTFHYSQHNSSNSQNITTVAT